MTGILHIGNALDVLRRLPSELVHCCVTSPPYWGLRDYGAEGQLGLEPTPEKHVSAVVAVFEEVRRVLRSDGTLWMNYGDCYVGSGGQGKEQGGQCNGAGYKHMAPGSRAMTEARTGLKTKDLVGMPWMVAFALRAAGWYLRSDIIWHKPNPMPESVTDRPTSAHEYLFLLAKSPRYFYDADAIREATGNEADLATYAAADGHTAPSGNLSQGKNAGFGSKKVALTHPAGRNKRSVWTVATQPYSGAHFATFPPKLITPCILAGTSERGCCSSCGAPWVRVTSPATGGTIGTERSDWRLTGHERHGMSRNRLGGHADYATYQPRTTTGWQPSCKCDAAPEPCTVLDPFGGSGTTAEVAEALGRRWVLIELNPEYEPLIRQRTAQRGLFSR